MRKIILNLAVTLDGYIEGPNGETDWCRLEIDSDGPEIENHFDTFLSGIDTIFYGRVSYDQWGQYQPEESASSFEKKLWQNVHSKSKYVFTHNPDFASGKVQVIRNNVAEQVKAIKNRPGKDIWLYGGSKLITTFINLNLIDNYLLAVYPVILGEGKPLFANVQDRKWLKLKNVTPSKSGVMLLDYDSVPH